VVAERYLGMLCFLTLFLYKLVALRTNGFKRKFVVVSCYLAARRF